MSDHSSDIIIIMVLLSYILASLSLSLLSLPDLSLSLTSRSADAEEDISDPPLLLLLYNGYFLALHLPHHLPFLLTLFPLSLPLSPRCFLLPSLFHSLPLSSHTY